MLKRLKQALTEDRVLRVFGLGQLCHPKLVEMVGMQGGFDAVWLDQEHCGLSIEQIEHAVRGARAAQIDSFVRLTATDYATVMRPHRAHDDVDVRRVPDELPVRLERELGHDPGGELVDRIEALREQRKERRKVDRPEPEQWRREQQR